MKTKYTFNQKMRYYFDNTLSKGTISIIGWLAVLSAALIIIFSTVYTLFGLPFEEGSDTSFVEYIWQSLMRSVDPGTVAGDYGWGLRLVGLLITIGGIFIFSTLIGVLTSGLDDRLKSIRKGRSLVIEENHTLILGWSSKIFHVISELITANENQKRGVIVILAEKDKIEMEDEIRDNIIHLRGTRIICRTGSPINIKDLAIVNPNTAKSIIVLSQDRESADNYVIKSVLAITHNPKRKKEKYHIVAEIKEKENLDAANLVGNNEAVFIYTPEFTARITAQTCRQSGLSIVYTQLLCFEGDEMYFAEANGLVGKTYKEATFAYNKSAVIGILGAAGKIMINPAQDIIINESDKILAISEDDDTLLLSGKDDYQINFEFISGNSRSDEKAAEKNLVLGWNHRGFIIVKELDKYVRKGSSLTVIAENIDDVDLQNKLSSEIKNQELNIKTGDNTRKAVLSEIDVSSYDNIIILSYLNIDAEEADAKTLISLLHIRDIAKQAGKKLNIVSEMNIIENKELAEVTESDDFIISENLISGIISQLSESTKLKVVFDYLFDSKGSEIYLKDSSNYVMSGKALNFYTVLESASKKGETAIGYRLVRNSHSVEDNYGIVVNPDKEKFINFEEGDKIIVLSED